MDLRSYKSNTFKDDTSVGGGSRGQQVIKKRPSRRESSVKSTVKVRKKVSKKNGCKMINDYTVERRLGQGTFATVYLCKEHQTGTYYALKRMNKSFLSAKSCGPTKSAYDCVREELKVLQRLEHPNVVWLHEIIDDPGKDHLYLVTDFHSRGSLGDVIENMN
jgi:serine/threonine protein kinase